MAQSTHYIESIVPILSKGKKIGIAFVVKKDENHTYLLTCKHVVFDFDNNEYREALSLREDFCENFSLSFDESHVTLCRGIDLALIKVNELESKRASLLQKHQYDENLLVSTFSNSEHGLIHENIEATIERKTTLNHGKNYAAFLLEVDEALESGYSGSPLYDHNTGHVIGVVNIKDGESSAYAIDIKEAKELIEDLAINVFEDSHNNNINEHTAYVFFEYIKDNSYRLWINNTDLFDKKPIDIFKNKENIISAIYDYCMYAPTGEERDDEIECVELVIPHHLFCEDIGLWKSSNSLKLIDNSELLIRNIKKINQSLVKTNKSIILWNELIRSTNIFKKISVQVSGREFLKNKKLNSAYLDAPSHEGTPFDRVTTYSNILLWINDCESPEKYNAFLEKILNQTVDEFPDKFRTIISNSSNHCSMNANLMWDNPNTLPKAYYE